MLSQVQPPPRTQTRRRPTTSLATSMVALAAASLSVSWSAGPFTISTAEAKTPGKTYCFYRVCHRVMTLEETRRAVGKRMVLHTSHYDDPKKDRFNPSNLTSSGEWFRAGVPDNAASPKLPNGTVILAWNPATRQSAVLRINNAGPYWGSRTLDVSRAAAERLGFARQGVAKLHVEIVRAATKEDVTYRKGRRYAAVPGPIGTHATFEMALASTRQLMRLPAPATTTLVASLPTGAMPEREIETRAGPIPATSEPRPLAPAMPAAIAAVAALTQNAGANPSATDDATAAERGTSADSIAATPLIASIGSAQLPASRAVDAAPAKVASARAKLRKSVKVAKLVAPARVAQLTRAAKKVRTAKVAVKTNAQPLKSARSALSGQSGKSTRVAQVAKQVTDGDTPQQPRRARIRTGVVELSDSGAAQQRIRTSNARLTMASYTDIDDEAREPAVRRSATAQRRAVNSYRSARLPAACRDGSASCEFTTSQSGRVTSVRSWRVSSSKRE